MPVHSGNAFPYCVTFKATFGQKFSSDTRGLEGENEGSNDAEIIAKPRTKWTVLSYWGHEKLHCYEEKTYMVGRFALQF